MKKEEVIRTLMEAEKKRGLVDTLHRVFGKNIRINLGFSKSACDSGIEELDLSARSYHALCREKVFTLGDLIERLNEGDLKKIRNLGTKSFSEIQTKMLVFGFERLSENEKREFFRYLVENNTAC